MKWIKHRKFSPVRIMSLYFKSIFYFYSHLFIWKGGLQREWNRYKVLESYLIRLYIQYLQKKV